MRHYLALLVLPLLLTSCASINSRMSSLSTERVQEIVSEVSEFGTTELLRSKPEFVDEIELIVAALTDLIDQKAVTAMTLRQLVSAIPVKALKTKNAQLALGGATFLYDIAGGNIVDLESNGNAMAAAIGLRDGLSKALGGGK